MKVLLLDGSRKGVNELAPVRAALEKELGAKGWPVQVVELRDLDISACTGCFNCWIKTPGICTIDDDARKVSRKWVGSDLVILLSPVTFGGYSSVLKTMMDRNIGIVLPLFGKVEGKVHHKKRYERYPVLLGIGIAPAPDAESERIFKELVHRNSLNMYAPRQIATVFSGTIGPEELGREVRALLDKAGVAA
jgi:hypothetical protein